MQPYTLRKKKKRLLYATQSSQDYNNNLFKSSWYSWPLQNSVLPGQDLISSQRKFEILPLGSRHAAGERSRDYNVFSTKIKRLKS